jgi:hypothetical protein
MTVQTLRIAMWSGPRNISTAMMRAFGNRADTAVVDEPYYAAYLAATGLDHPMRAEVLASQPHDPAAVERGLAAAAAAGTAAIQYEKHMTHHMLAGFDRSFLAGVASAFLIRRPENVLASYARKRGGATLADIGLVEQWELFQAIADRLGHAPPVVDATDVANAPRDVLTRLCAALAIPFDPAMLTWPPGRRATDGVWAPHWYHAVEASTGFSPAGPDVARADLPADLKAVAAAAEPLYAALARHRIRPEGHS